MSDSPAYSFGLKFEEKKLSKSRASTPGPGQYDTSTPRQGKKYSFGIRFKEKKISNNSPGPGAYGVPRQNDSPRYTFGTKSPIKPKNSKSKPGTPGPGAYRPEDTPKRVRSTPRMHADTYQSKRKGNNDFPGPGTYVIGTALKINKGWTMGKRFESSSEKRKKSKNSSDTPGPASYSPEKFNHTIKGGSFGRISSNTIKMNRKSTPGPGSYAEVNIDVCRTKAPVVSMSPRLEPKSNRNKESPGPGQYNVGKSSSSRGPSYTISPRYKERKSDISNVPYYYPLRTARGAFAGIGRSEWGSGPVKV